MDDDTLLPQPAAGELVGRGRSSFYADIKAGLMTRPGASGPNSQRWPAGEVRRIIRARIAGESDDAIRALVTRLHEARKVAA